MIIDLDNEQGEFLLIIDDEAFNLDILSRRLKKAGYDVDTATDGEHAWEVLQQSERKFDAIILDRMMPRLNGIELLKRIKADDRFSDIPVIMQTAAAAPEQVQEGLNAGAYYYLTKPFEGSVLLSIVKAAINDNQQKNDLKKQIDQGVKTLQHLKKAEFQFFSIDDTHAMATTIANACPEPDRIVMGINELLINAVEHGNLGITYREKTELMTEDRLLDEIHLRQALPENQKKLVTIQFERRSDLIEITIIDEGEGFDWEKYLEIDPSRAFDPHGRGIAMSRMLSVDELEYVGNGNTVKLRVFTD